MPVNIPAKALAALLLAALVCAALVPALAAPAEIREKVLEETQTFETDTLNIKIDRWRYAYKKDTLRFFVAHVKTASPAQLQTAFAGEAYTKKAAEATSDIAARHNAVLAINGDYYNYKDDVAMIIRNGVLYRDKSTTRDQLLVYADGRFEALSPDIYAAGRGEEYLAAGVMQCFAFGPALLKDGQICTLPEKYIVSTGDTIREPRTAIGQVDETHYVILVADGRRGGWSDKGMTLQEMQHVFLEEGCRTAYNLDGGGSSTLIVNGEKINRSSGSRERDVSDIVYFTN